MIDAIEILPALFEEVSIPPAVRDELLAEGAAEKVRKWIEDFPDWLKILTVGEINKDIKLGQGETEAISLAVKLSADFILLDDKAARLGAAKKNLKVIGTLGVLKFADQSNN